MQNIDIKRVRYFLRLSETLSFSGAARALKVSQPGFTKAITGLEHDIGGPLIRREGRNTHLTPLGKAVLPYFKELDMSAARAEAAARRLSAGDMPTLHIGLMCTIGPDPISAFLTRYRQSAPDLEIVIRDLNRSDLSETLLSGAVDVALVGAEIGDVQRFRYLKLYVERMVVACAPGHPFAGRRSVDLGEVLREPYVDRLQCEFRDTFLAEANRRAFAPIFAARSDREEWAQSLVAQGTGVALVPERSTVVPDLVLVPLSEPQLERSVSLAVPIGREDTEVVQKFLGAVRTHKWKDQ
jgi:LysR family hydrogen peroxide-inducible transcriptional activator